DTSPGGYRLRWNEPLPANVETGELLAMRDETDPRWCIAVIRWIRQDAEGPDMGIELLAPQATPMAARVVQKKGGPTEYTRAFLLPEIDLLGQPASLITPLLPFQTGQKIHLTEHGTQTTAQLGECLLKTESFNQFTFRVLDGYLENPRGHRNMSSLDQMTNNQKTGSR
ncbi:MAG: molecular chaperone, partial [Pseudomonadales bacterium]